jgi:hypothetical protein
VCPKKNFSTKMQDTCPFQGFDPSNTLPEPFSGLLPRIPLATALSGQGQSLQCDPGTEKEQTQDERVDQNTGKGLPGSFWTDMRQHDLEETSLPLRGLMPSRKSLLPVQTPRTLTNRAGFLTDRCSSTGLIACRNLCHPAEMMVKDRHRASGMPGSQRLFMEAS